LRTFVALAASGAVIAALPKLIEPREEPVPAELSRVAEVRPFG
jgi:hypothetical protein